MQEAPPVWYDQWWVIVMRAFFCIPSDEELSRRLSAVSADLRARMTARVSWVAEGNFHVTVRFLGEIEPMLAVELERMARRIAGEVPPFDLVIDRLGAFPTPERARVIWAGGKAPSEFTKLVSKVNQGLAEFGFPPDRKEAIAHITLGRVKERPDPRVPQALSELEQGLDSILHVDRLVLMESVLTPRGAVYNPLFSVSLTGG